jgi:hypothetical protein
MNKVNGKLVNLPKYVTPDDVIKVSREKRPKRLVLMKTRQGYKKLDKYVKTYVPDDAELKIVPKRIKAFSYGQGKSRITRQIIRSQVEALQSRLFTRGIEIDDEYDWIMIRSYRLPYAWRKVNDKHNVPILIVLPDEFPSLPPNGFYMPGYVNSPYGDHHFFSPGFGGSHVGESYRIRKKTDRWAWYCSRIDPSSWSPATIRRIEDWVYGDNLFDVASLISSVLSDPDGD